MSKILEEVKKMWENFDPPRCKQCGGQNVIWENSVGCSDTSGAWGDISIVCKDCERYEEKNELMIFEPY